MITLEACAVALCDGCVWWRVGQAVVHSCSEMCNDRTQQRY